MSSSPATAGYTWYGALRVPDKAQRLKADGNDALKRGKVLEAVGLYSQAVALCPHHPVFLANRALAYCKCERFSDALADATAAIDADPSYLKAYARAVTAHTGLGNVLRALGSVEAGVDAADVAGVPADSLERMFFVREAQRLRGRMATTLGELSGVTSPAPDCGDVPLRTLRSAMVRLLVPAVGSALLQPVPAPGSRFLTPADTDLSFRVYGLESVRSMARWAPDAAAFLSGVFTGDAKAGVALLCATVDGATGRLQAATMTPFPSPAAVGVRWRALCQDTAVAEADPTLASTLVAAAWSTTPASVAKAMPRDGQVAALVLSAAVKTPDGTMSANPRTAAVLKAVRGDGGFRAACDVAVAGLHGIVDAITADEPPPSLDAVATVALPRAMPPGATPTPPAAADGAPPVAVDVVASASVPPVSAAATTTKPTSITSQPLPPIMPPRRAATSPAASTTPTAPSAESAMVDDPEFWSLLVDVTAARSSATDTGVAAIVDEVCAPAHRLPRLGTAASLADLWLQCQTLQLLRIRNERRASFDTAGGDAALAAVRLCAGVVTGCRRALLTWLAALSSEHRVPGPEPAAHALVGGGCAAAGAGAGAGASSSITATERGHGSDTPAVVGSASGSPPGGASP